MEPGLLEALLELPGASCRPVSSADTARGLAGSRQARLELEGEALELLGDLADEQTRVRVLRQINWLALSAFHQVPALAAAKGGFCRRLQLPVL